MNTVITAEQIPLLQRLEQYKLRSVKDVIPAQVHLYTDSLTSLAQEHGLLMLHAERGTALPADALDRIRERVNTVKMFAEECELKQSVQRCDHVLKVLDKYPDRANHIQNALRGLLESFSYETNEKRFLYLSAGEVQFFLAESDEEFEVKKDHILYQEACHDMDGALKCFCFGQYTACVFHLMRLLESLVHIIWKSTNQPKSDTDMKGWGEYDAALKRLLEGTSENKLPEGWDKERREFYIQIRADLSLMKDAERNHVMHTGRVYSERHTRVLLHGAKVLIGHALAHIDAQGNYTP